MSRTDPQFNLRIPEDLRDKVTAAAKENKRSATAEILARLEESFANQIVSETPKPAGGVHTIVTMKGSEPGDVAIPVTREELWAVIGQAISEALDGKLGAATPLDITKQPNTGPKPSKSRPAK